MYLITYLNRVNISTAAPVISKAFGVDKETIGVIFSAFGWVGLCDVSVARSGSLIGGIVDHNRLQEARRTIAVSQGSSRTVISHFRCSPALAWLHFPAGGLMADCAGEDAVPPA
jgi:hypothetical protein